MGQARLPGLEGPVSTQEAQNIVNTAAHNIFGQVSHSVRFHILVRADDLVEDDFYYTAQGFHGHFAEAFNHAHSEIAYKNIAHTAPILRIWRIVSITEADKDA